MAAIKVDPDKVREFPDAESFHAWLAENHAGESEVWIKVHKVGSGLASITPKEAIDVVLCFGWIDAVRKSLDDKSFLQRYTPRGRKSIWSKINIDNVARLIEAGRMTKHGLDQVEAAKADGRWAAAYEAQRDFTVPDDLRAALHASPPAEQAFDSAGRTQQYAVVLAVVTARTERTRSARIEKAVRDLVGR